MPNLLNSREVAERLHVSVDTINRWARDGLLTPEVQLPGLRGARLYSPAEVDRLAADLEAVSS